MVGAAAVYRVKIISHIQKVCSYQTAVSCLKCLSDLPDDQQADGIRHTINQAAVFLEDAVKVIIFESQGECHSHDSKSHVKSIHEFLLLNLMRRSYWLEL